jgi:tetratricopeptide (TPR) repeat protein
LATRLPSDELAGLPDLVIHGLKREEAKELLKRALPGPVDEQVTAEIIAETDGNPLALLELPRAFRPGELAGGYGLLGGADLSESIEESFHRRFEALHADTRRLLLLVAAEPLGDPLLVWRAATYLGIDPAAARQAVDSELAVFGTTVHFRHPLVRSAIYQSASAEERYEVHRALAEATDPAIDLDRRAWHRAQAALRPDEDVAVELVHSAGRAQARGGFAAAAAFLARAAVLTPDPARRAPRALEAAQAKLQAGALSAALELLAMAEAGPLGELEHGRADLGRAQIAFVTYRGGDAPRMLLEAAQRLEPVAPDLAGATYLEALLAAIFASGLAGPGGSVLDVARAISTTAVSAPTTADDLLEGMAATFIQGYAAGLPTLRRAVTDFRQQMPIYQGVGLISLAFIAAVHTWDDDACEEISDQWCRICREAGALSDLPVALHTRAWVLVFAGDLGGAASVTDEVRAAIEATEINFGEYGPLALAAYGGDEAAAPALVDASIKDGLLGGEGSRLSAAEWANAVLNNGLGRYEQALAAAQRASEYPWQFVFGPWALAELIEAATRSGRTEVAAGAYRRLAEMTGASGTNWALGIQARSQALLTEHEEAEAFYTEAIERLGRARECGPSPNGPGASSG